MGLFSNPLGYAGFPPDPETAQVVNSTVRAATPAEAAAGVLNNVYISPATQSSSVALDFASPPVLGFGSTNPRPVNATTLSSTSTTTLATTGASINTFGNSTAGTTVTLTGGAASLAVTNTGTTVTGSLLATTTITASAGNITASAGNFVSSTLGNGILLTSGTTSGTASATLNGRVGQITITTPSIAAGAQFTFTITNSAVTASTTQVGYWLTGGTNGSALTIQSVTNSASTSVVVINNGTAATANTASLVLTFLVLTL